MISLILAATLSFTEADAKLAYDTTKTLVEQYTPRDAGTVRGKIAANYILEAASSVGANVRRDSFLAETPHGKRWMTNLEAEFPVADPNSKWVILVSHYDTKPGVTCPGANDGASTSGLLVALARQFAHKSARKGNVMLIWTDGEECVNAYGEKDGLWGAKRAVARLQASGKQVHSVICLDMLGDKDLKIALPANADERLRKIALHAARKAGHGEIVTKVDDRIHDDHLPFQKAGYPSLLMIDFEYGEGNCYWHTAEDTMDKLSLQSFLAAGQITTALLNILL